MNAPFYRFGLFHDEVSLIVAFVIGIGFGFFLERAGFGSARKLTAQFYFKDLAVLKVMFTAIVTAMVGLYVVSRFGLVDLSLVHLTPTLLGPQIVGGLLLGIGFVIGGYCPGTSVVSAATGRLDAVVFLVGMLAGLFGFGEIYPAIARWTTVTAFGPLTLPAFLHLPYGVVVLAVVVMAIGAFIAAEWAEKTFGGVQPGPDSLTGARRRFNPARVLAAGLVGLGLVAAVSGNPYREGRVTIETRRLAQLAGNVSEHVSPVELSAWILEGRADYTLIDLRGAADFAQHRIPGARNVPLASLTDTVAPRIEKIVVYAQDDTHAAQAWILMKALGFKAVYALAGGLDAWNAEVLFPAKPAEDTATANVEFAKRVAVARHFGGTPRGAAAPGKNDLPALTPPPPPPASTAAPSATPAKKKREGC
jgi:rhodanese-related sulfurtransferase